MNKTNFGRFLHEVEETNFETNITAKGVKTIKQTPRNELRRAGVEALKADLEDFYGDDFEVLETDEGLVVVAENMPGDFTVSWEVKLGIKALDYDPFIAASNFEDARASQQAKKAASEADKIAKAKRLEEKRNAKLAELEAKRAFYR